jgi:hypothetical protein
MLGKFLLTAAVIVLAFYVIRQRAGSAGDSARRGAAAPGDSDSARGPVGLLARRHLIQIAAGVVVVTMLVGSALTLLQGWERGRDIITVEVANPITGAVERFEARRTDVGEQTIRTLDGRRIRVSEVERIIIRDDP